MRFLPAAALLLLAAAGAVAQDAPPPPPPPKEAPAGPPAPVQDDAYLQRITDEMLEKIVTIRGLKSKAPIERRWTERDKMRTELLAQMEKDIPPEKMAAWTRMLAFFALVPPGTDLKNTLADGMAGAVAGYYDPEVKTFYLVRGFSIDGSRPIVFHELTHAVEDQYYDYHAQMKHWDEVQHTDRGLGIKALVEGSAQLFTENFMDSEPGLEDRFYRASMAEAASDGGKAMQAQMEMPPFLAIEMALYPYHNGSRFLRRVLPEIQVKEGEDKLARLYADPPASSEMILHPEKYLGKRDLPQEVALPDLAGALGEGWTAEPQDTIGELETGIILNAILLPKGVMAQTMGVALAPEGGLKKPSDVLKFAVGFRGETHRAVTGWDGDRMGLYLKGDAVSMAWALTFDSAGDAGEFAETYQKVVAKKYAADAPPPKEGEPKPRRIPAAAEPFAGHGWTGQIFKATGEGCSTFVVSNGAHVLIAERVPADRVDAVLAAMAKATFTQDPKDGLPAK